MSCSVWPLSLLEAGYLCYSSTALAGGYSCVTPYPLYGLLTPGRNTSLLLAYLMGQGELPTARLYKEGKSAYLLHQKWVEVFSHMVSNGSRGLQDVSWSAGATEGREVGLAQPSSCHARSMWISVTCLTITDLLA